MFRGGVIDLDVNIPRWAAERKVHNSSSPNVPIPPISAFTSLPVPLLPPGHGGRDRHHHLWYKVQLEVCWQQMEVHLVKTFMTSILQQLVEIV